MIEQLGEKEAEIWRNKTLEQCLDDENDYECSFGEHAISAVVRICLVSPRIYYNFLADFHFDELIVHKLTSN